MENAVEGLKMAGAVLLFVMAISIAILSFGQVRATADTILDYEDRETEYINGNYYYETRGTEREVGLETIIPTVKRAFVENYKVVFKWSENKYLYRVKDSKTGQWVEKNVIDLETSSDKNTSSLAFPSDDNVKTEFLNRILYGKCTDENKLISDLDKKIDFYNTINVYDYLKSGKTIKEYTGVYYQDETDSSVPDANKTKKRIIIYEVN